MWSTTACYGDSFTFLCRLCSYLTGNMWSTTACYGVAYTYLIRGFSCDYAATNGAVINGVVSERLWKEAFSWFLPSHSRQRVEALRPDTGCTVTNGIFQLSITKSRLIIAFMPKTRHFGRTFPAPYASHLTDVMCMVINHRFVTFEVFTAVTMKNGVFWDIKLQFVLHRRRIRFSLQSPAS
jgi:hypothetical protein